MVEPEVVGAPVAVEPHAAGALADAEGARAAAASALIMLLGSKLVSPKDFFNSLLFAIELGIFLAAIGFAFKAWKGFDSKSIMESAKDICLIVSISALALILGGLTAKYVGIENIINH